MKTTILVAAHKAYRMPEETIYMPLHVGREGKQDLGFRGDNTGENISAKNANYCELTGLYWAWKNLECDVLGMAHYRRHFGKRRSRKPDWNNVITEREISALLETADAILPARRDYVIETTYQQYIHAHNKQDLTALRELIIERCPEYLGKYDEVMNRTWGHRFNMFIMKRAVCDAYCAWLFDLLFALEERLDISHYSVNDQRVFGFVAERLIDVWLEHNGVRTCEAPVMFMERQNWLKKGGAFIWRKLRAGLPGRHKGA